MRVSRAGASRNRDDSLRLPGLPRTARSRCSADRRRPRPCRL